MLLSLFEQFLRLEKQASPHTISAYRRDLKELDEFLQGLAERSLFEASDVKGIKHNWLREWLAYLTEKGLSTRSIARKISSAKSYFHFLEQSEILAGNPALRLRVARFEAPLPAFLKETETEHLLAELNFTDDFNGQRNRCLLELLYGCGLRRSELIGLQRSAIDLPQRLLRVLGKGNKTRILPFGKHVTEAIHAYEAAAKAERISLEAAFFVRPNGQALYPKLVYTIVRKALDSVSSLRQGGPHVLRHTFATHLLNQGADLNAIKELLGHSSLAATQVYTHNSIAKLKAVHLQAHPRAETREH